MKNIVLLVIGAFVFGPVLEFIQNKTFRVKQNKIFYFINMYAKTTSIISNFIVLTAWYIAYVISAHYMIIANFKQSFNFPTVITIGLAFFAVLSVSLVTSSLTDNDTTKFYGYTVSQLIKRASLIERLFYTPSMMVLQFTAFISMFIMVDNNPFNFAFWMSSLIAASFFLVINALSGLLMKNKIQTVSFTDENAQHYAMIIVGRDYKEYSARTVKDSNLTLPFKYLDQSLSSETLTDKEWSYFTDTTVEGLIFGIKKSKRTDSLVASRIQFSRIFDDYYSFLIKKKLTNDAQVTNLVSLIAEYYKKNSNTIFNYLIDEMEFSDDFQDSHRRKIGPINRRDTDKLGINTLVQKMIEFSQGQLTYPQLRGGFAALINTYKQNEKQVEMHDFFDFSNYDTQEVGGTKLLASEYLERVLFYEYYKNQVEQLNEQQASSDKYAKLVKKVRSDLISKFAPDRIEFMEYTFDVTHVSDEIKSYVMKELQL